MSKAYDQGARCRKAMGDMAACSAHQLILVAVTAGPTTLRRITFPKGCWLVVERLTELNHSFTVRPPPRSPRPTPPPTPRRAAPLIWRAICGFPVAATVGRMAVPSQDALIEQAQRQLSEALQHWRGPHTRLNLLHLLDHTPAGSALPVDALDGCVEVVAEKLHLCLLGA